MIEANTKEKVQNRKTRVLISCTFVLVAGCGSDDGNDISSCNSATVFEDLVLDPLSTDAARSLLVGSWEFTANEAADCKQLVNFHCDLTFDNASLDERQTGTWDVKPVDDFEEAVLLEVDTLTDNEMMNCNANSNSDLGVLQVLLSYPDENTMIWSFNEAGIVFTRTTQTQ